MEPINPRAPGSPAGIEVATWRDLNQLRYIEKICFPQDYWPLWDLIGVLTFPNVVRLKAIVDGLMVGFIAGDLRTSERMAWIATVCVLPEYRGRGVGNALMTACEARLELPTIRLSVRISNQGAVKLYEHLGYQRIGIWPGYYQDGEDALVMEKQRQGLKNS
jgi:ribosomal protein S18 acetylase RimI-like enzyme